MAASFSGVVPNLSNIAGNLTDAQHGALTVANAHAHSALSGLIADQHHRRTEAKRPSLSVTLAAVATWTTAFASIPAVAVALNKNAVSRAAAYSVSTTGANVQDQDGAELDVLSIIAQEAT